MAPQLIVVSGLPGTGKTALATELARKMGVPVFSVDPIEDGILATGLPRGFQTGLAAYIAAERLAEVHLRIGQSVIIDAVNAEEEAKDMWRQMAKRHALPLRILVSVCSDATLHRERLAQRRRELRHIPEPTWEQVMARRALVTAWTEIHLILDSVAGLAENASRAMKWLG